MIRETGIKYQQHTFKELKKCDQHELKRDLELTISKSKNDETKPKYYAERVKYIQDLIK